MKLFGIKAIPLLASTVAIYIIGAIIYGALFSAQWMEWSNFTQEDFKGYEWRMAISWVMPLALSILIGKSLEFKKPVTFAAILIHGISLGILLILSVRLYLFVYGIEKWQILALDSFHIILICIASSIILTKMKALD